MPTALRALLLAVVFTVLPVGVGVAMTGGPKAAAPPAYVSTALGDYDTTTVIIGHGAFCGQIAGDAVTTALGTAASTADGYGDGQRYPIGGHGKGDVLHESGCVFRAGRIQARAWVFAPPVTRARARQLVAASDKGCAKPASAPAFGSPSTASICGGSTSRTATFRGLFGDAWLSCSLTAPGVDATTLLDRAGRWCVAVARAASVS